MAQGQADLDNKGTSRAPSLAPADPRGAILVLEAVTPLAPKGDETTALARELLERVVAQSPTTSRWSRAWPSSTRPRTSSTAAPGCWNRSDRNWASPRVHACSA